MNKPYTQLLEEQLKETREMYIASVTKITETFEEGSKSMRERFTRSTHWSVVIFSAVGSFLGFFGVALLVLAMKGKATPLVTEACIDEVMNNGKCARPDQSMREVNGTIVCACAHPPPAASSTP